MAFHFKKPDNFSYIAGQYGDFTLIDPSETDDEGNKRTFSFASSPFESELVIVTRIRNSAFKRNLQNLLPGSEVLLDGPFGSLTLPKNTDKTAVFMTSGIGATLVHSIVKQAVHDNAPHSMIFFYINRTKDKAIFFDEFAQLARTHKNFLFIPITPNTNEKQGGIIQDDLFERHLDHITSPIYYLSGPGPIMGIIRKMLLDRDVVRTDIRADQFVGYKT